MGFDPRNLDAVLVLLAIDFKPTDAPGGEVTLQFAAGVAIRLEVETIEAEFKDLGAEWSTFRKPDHSAAEGETPEQERTDDKERLIKP